MQQWQGPLPPPGALRQFDEIIPGGAQRIFEMVEREQAHRIQHEQQKLSATVGDFRRGQWMGYTLGIVCVAASAYTAYIGAHPTVSIALVSLPIMAAIRGFLNKRQ
jgi:uncharacterized membrane protein